MTTVVRDGQIDDPNYNGDWVKWLESQKSFRYECRHGNITVIKDGGYWTASKKVNGELRRKRLGTSESVTVETLTEAAKTLCINVFWKERLKEQGESKRDTKEGLREYADNLKRQLEDSESRVKALEARLGEVSQNSCDTVRVERLESVVNDFQSRARDTRDWVQAKRLIEALREVMTLDL